MTIGSVADYQSALKRRIRYAKSGGDNTQLGGSFPTWFDMTPGAGDPGAIAAPANTTSGTMPTRATSGYPDIGDLTGMHAYLSRVQFELAIQAGAGGNAGRLLLYDRLWDAGPFVTAGSPYTLSGQPSIAARIPGGTDYSGLQLWGMGGGSNTNTTMVFTYTNQAGTTGRTTPSFTPGYFLAGSTNPKWGAYLIPLQAGDTGIQKVESVTLTGASNNCNLMIIRPLWMGPVNVGSVTLEHGILRTGLPEVFADSALQVMAQYNLVSVSNALEMLIELAVK